MKYSVGLTVADLVFPWFMWIMGVSIVFSFRGRKDRGILKILYQIVRRTVILFGLGLFLNNGEQQCIRIYIATGSTYIHMSLDCQCFKLTSISNYNKLFPKSKVMCNYFVILKYID